jgi:hypothetical protein
VLPIGYGQIGGVTGVTMQICKSNKNTREKQEGSDDDKGALGILRVVLHALERKVRE